MFPNLFGANNATPPQSAQLVEDEQTRTLDITTRRTEAEVYKLVRTFQATFEDMPELRKRLEYFWPSAEFSDRVLFTIAHDIPKAENPLWPNDPNELFPDEQQNAVDDEEGNESEDSVDVVFGTKTAIKSRRKKKKRPVMTQPKCVEWLGLVNEKNGFAAVKLTMPATFESWVTWASRIIVYLFGVIPNYEVPEDFVRQLDPPEGGPFPMRCKNPRCVRLSHINYMPAHLKAAFGLGGIANFAAESKYRKTEGSPESSRMGIDSASSPRGLGLALPSWREAVTSKGFSKDTGMSMLDRKKTKKKKHESSSDEEGATTTAAAAAENKRVIWSPGFD